MRTFLLVVILMAVVSAAGWAADPAKTSEGLEENVVKILRTSNVAQTNRFVCETLVFNKINPFNVINFLWAPLSREEGAIFSYAHPSEEKGLVVVVTPEYQLDSLRKLARDLDRPKLTSAPGSKYIYYRLKHRNVLDPGFLTVSQYYAGATGVLIPDVETNSVQIFDAPEGAVQVEQAFNTILDQPLRQVEMEVKVYEVFVNSDGALGLDFEAWKNGPGAVLGQFEARGAYLNAKGIGHTHTNQRTSGLYLDYPSAFFDALVHKGKAEIVLNTNIVAVNRVPAVLSTGDQILFYDVDNLPFRRTVTGEVENVQVDGLAFPTDGRVLSGGGPGSPYRSPSIDGSFPLPNFPQENRPIDSVISSVDTGLSFSVVPVIADEMTRLSMELKLVDVSGYDGTGQPLLNSRAVSDAISVANGDEAIFGGLVRERTIQTTRKVPFFGSLPVIGYLFGGEISTTRKSIFVAAVTPRLVEGNNNVTAEDEQLVKQATGEEVVVLPQTEFCFEQSMPYTY